MDTKIKSNNRPVRRKNIDIPEDTFRFLSVKAAAQGTNLKKYIESLLERSVEDLEDSELYAYLNKTDPAGKIMLSKAEQDEFEKWVGV
jgi:hypothetical protein